VTGSPPHRDPSASASAAETEAAVVASEDPYPWWMAAALGCISIAFGIAILVWPDVTVRVMAVFVGIWFLAAGVTRVFGAFTSGRGVGPQVLSGIVGVLLVLGGIACLRNLVAGLAAVATLVALTWLLSGMAELVLAFTVTGSARTTFLLLGGLSTVVGIVFAVWPELSLATLVLTTSVGAIVVGASQLVCAFMTRRLARTV
jgi:uncharacterized membrane protein HdeD (DUF308 family)